MAAEPMLTQVSDPQGWDRPGPRRHARVQFTDGTWHSTTVLGWRHRDDHWYAHLRWPGGHTEWRLYDPRYIHPELAGAHRSPEHLERRRASGGTGRRGAGIIGG